MALPFDLPSVSLGFAQLTPRARELGARAAAETARALAQLTDSEVSVTGRPLPGLPACAAGALQLRVELTALAATAAVEIEAPLAVALLDRLAGGSGAAQPATSVTPMERAALELALLAAIDGVAAVPELEAALAPRLARGVVEPFAGLAVEVSVSLGSGPGRARVVLPAAAVRAIGHVDPASAPGAGLALPLSLRGGSAPLSPEELDALEPGDVVLLDLPVPSWRRAVAPGGLCLVGSEAHQHLHIEEIVMPDAASGYPIALEVELARVPITLGELARLEPGAILPLPVDRRGLVTLKLGDLTVGRGELVDVEGALGVRIDTLRAVRP